MENLSRGSHTGFWGDLALTLVTSLVARLASADWLAGGEAWDVELHPFCADVHDVNQGLIDCWREKQY